MTNELRPWHAVWTKEGFERRRRSRHVVGLRARLAVAKDAPLELVLIERASAEGALLRVPPRGPRLTKGQRFALGFVGTDGAACVARGIVARCGQPGHYGVLFADANAAFIEFFSGLDDGGFERPPLP